MPSLAGVAPGRTRRSSEKLRKAGNEISREVLRGATSKAIAVALPCGRKRLAILPRKAAYPSWFVFLLFVGASCYDVAHAKVHVFGSAGHCAAVAGAKAGGRELGLGCLCRRRNLGPGRHPRCAIVQRRHSPRQGADRRSWAGLAAWKLRIRGGGDPGIRSFPEWRHLRRRIRSGDLEMELRQLAARGAIFGINRRDV